MKSIHENILTQLTDMRVDCLIQSALCNQRVLKEAEEIDYDLKQRRLDRINAEMERNRTPPAPTKILPTAEELKAFGKTKKGMFVGAVLTLAAITTLSNAVYRIYLRLKLPQCSKIINQTARHQCIYYYKIQACIKTINRLKELRTPKNSKNIDARIEQIKQKINKIKKHQLNTGLKF